VWQNRRLSYSGQKYAKYSGLRDRDEIEGWVWDGSVENDVKDGFAE
jgi:hypothetical protein